MKAISVLGTSSNSGKSWLATALCAWLARKGLRVAPFKAQNMSNNSYVTLDGGEIGRAQAAQAEACGLLPTVEMNPILLKPTGSKGSQLVVLGKAQRHLKASEYYDEVEGLWTVITNTLEAWKTRCDVLVLEGAGSPVELNLASRDIVNLRPVHYLDGKWLLVADIERGGVFAQAIGTWTLMHPHDQARGLGLVVNKFRGDLSLFSGARDCFESRMALPYLGTLPFRGHLQPESEDSLCRESEQTVESANDAIVWIRLPNLSNSQDCQPWLADEGVSIRWASKPAELANARAVVIPGSKNTIADLQWLHETGLAGAVKKAAAAGTPVVGICGGYQMLGSRVCDPEGIAGNSGSLPGLDLLPIQTSFSGKKEVRQISAVCGADEWTAYEIHMGQTEPLARCEALLTVNENGQPRPEGCSLRNIWGTYLHGVFESRAVRTRLAELAGFTHYQPSSTPWRERKARMYDGMATLLEEHLDLEGIWNYVAG